MVDIALLSVAEHFSVRFEGPAVGDDNAIDAAVFGGSLLALADLIAEARELVHPDGPRYRIRVQSTGPGSFEVFLEITELWDAVANFFTDRDTQAVVTLLALFGPGGLFALLRWLKGRKPDKVEDAASGTVFTVDDKTLVVERKVGSLYSSRKVRQSARRFIQPVTPSIVDELTVKVPQAEPTVLTPEDRPAFDVPIDDDDTVTDQVVDMSLRLEMIRFRSNRWEFREPMIGLLWATIEDEGFLRRVDERTEQFEKGDTLDCRVRIRQWDEGHGAYRTDYTILSVLDHRPSDEGRQLTIQSEHVAPVETVELLNGGDDQPNGALDWNEPGSEPE